MKRYWVYILLCSDGTYYTGNTSNLEQRIIEHNTKRFPDSYTSKRIPVSLAFSEEFTDARLAREYERKLKKWSHGKKDALIKGEIDRLHILAECRNITHFRYQNNRFKMDT
ncbi:MAG: GIY-YIG nuclease family protein [Bacteroidota bacterium]